VTRRKLGRLRSPGAFLFFWTQFQNDTSSTDSVLKRPLNTLTTPILKSPLHSAKFTQEIPIVVVQSGSIGIKYVRQGLPRYKQSGLPTDCLLYPDILIPGHQFQLIRPTPLSDCQVQNLQHHKHED